jgi:hypothetical protein
MYKIFARAEASNVSVPNEFGLTILNSPTFCGMSSFSGILPGGDVKFCDGIDASGASSKQLNEVFNDDTSFVVSSMRVRQPFDFTNRTGTVVFDVDAKRNIQFDGHGWWLEFWLTADPTPIPYHGAPTVGSYVRSGVGFQIAPVESTCFAKENPICNQVGRVVVEQDYRIVRDTPLTNLGQIRVADGKLNRFKVLVSKNHIEFWASNYDEPGKLYQICVADNLGLDFSTGYIHLQHTHYNSPKRQASSSQTFRWDNVAFDGPTYPTPRAYDVADRTTLLTPVNGVQAMQFGYELAGGAGGVTPMSVQVHGVDLTNAVSATFNFNFFTKGGRTLTYRFNGHDWHNFVVPSQLGTDFLLRTFSLPVSLAELTAGDNTIEAKVDGTGGYIEGMGNMDLTVEASP